MMMMMMMMMRRTVVLHVEHTAWVVSLRAPVDAARRARPAAVDQS